MVGMRIEEFRREFSETMSCWQKLCRESSGESFLPHADGRIVVARQAFEVFAVAAVTNESRRPSKPRDILQMQPDVPFHIDVDKFQHNLRTARRGAACGPSGMTAKHLRIVLESPACSSLLGEAASNLAQGNIPEEVARAVRLGRLTALQKPNGAVRGIVVGDFFRLVVARTMPQQYSKLGEAATHCFQHALSAGAGTECVTHIVLVLTSEEQEATILSIDGTGAFDLHSRNAMFSGVVDRVESDKLVPFIRLFYGSPSTFVWEDDAGTVRHVQQQEGGGQDHALMPLLFSIGFRKGLVVVKLQLGEVRNSSLSWMVCTSSASQAEPSTCSSCLNTSCTARRASACIRVKHRSGID